MPLGIFQGQRAQRAFRRFLVAPVFFAFPLIFLSPQDCRQQRVFSFPWSSYYPWLSLIPPRRNLLFEDSQWREFYFYSVRKGEGRLLFLLELGLWISDRNWHCCARQVSCTHTVVQVSQPKPQEQLSGSQPRPLSQGMRTHVSESYSLRNMWNLDFLHEIFLFLKSWHSYF